MTVNGLGARRSLRRPDPPQPREGQGQAL